MKNFACLTLIFLSFLSTLLKAQPYVDLANFQYTQFNKAPFKHNMNSTVNHSIIAGGFFLPLPLKNNNRLIIGGDNSSIKIDYSADDTSYTSHLYSTSLQLGVLKQWKNKKWCTLFLLIPRQAADFKDTKHSDLQLGGASITTYEWKKNIKFKIGLYYNREFYGNYFMPLGGIDWKINDKLDLWALMPGSLNVNYKLSKKLVCGLKYQSCNATFRAEGSNKDNYVREGDSFWSDQQLSLKADVYLTKNLVFYTGAGITGFHYYQDCTGKKNSDVYPQYQESRDRGFLYTGLSFRVSTE